jgi:hypothetical protein
MLPPTYRFPPTLAPPVTWNAPVLFAVAGVVELITKFPRAIILPFAYKVFTDPPTVRLPAIFTFPWIPIPPLAIMPPVVAEVDSVVELMVKFPEAMMFP